LAATGDRIVNSSTVVSEGCELSSRKISELSRIPVNRPDPSATWNNLCLLASIED
jgi:hypothetical protein